MKRQVHMLKGAWATVAALIFDTGCGLTALPAETTGKKDADAYRGETARGVLTRGRDLASKTNLCAVTILFNFLDVSRKASLGDHPDQLRDRT